MPESTLTLTVDDLNAEIGHYLGYGRGAVFNETAWNQYQLNNLKALLKTGLSNVYTPPRLSEREVPHNWSFLRPFGQFTLLPQQNTIDLPGTFAGFESPLYITTPTAANRNWLLQIANEGMVAQLTAQQPSTVGAPRIACEKVLPDTSRTGSTRSVIFVWPKSDSVYTLTASYKHLPSALTGSYPYPPGGAEHAELFKASCISAAEMQLDGIRGPRYQEFMDRLAASVYVDRKRKGQFIGFNADRSDNRTLPRMPGIWNRYFDNPAVTYNGAPL